MKAHDPLDSQDLVPFDPEVPSIASRTAVWLGTW